MPILHLNADILSNLEAVLPASCAREDSQTGASSLAHVSAHSRGPSRVSALTVVPYTDDAMADGGAQVAKEDGLARILRLRKFPLQVLKAAEAG